MGGAEHSMLSLLTGLRQEVSVRLGCPATSPFADAARELGVSIADIPSVDGSLKLHPRETPVALGRLSLAAARTARHAQRMNAHVIHGNSIRAGLFAVPAGRLAGIPTVVHIRDRLPRSQVADASLRMIASGAKAVVANSHYTAEGVRAVTARGNLGVVYNPVNLDQFNLSRVDRNAMRAELGLSSEAFVVAVVGQITPWKGQHEAIQALARVRQTHPDVELLIVGEPKFVSAATRYDNRAYYSGIQQLIATEQLERCVHLLGERSDVPAIMGALDAVLVPSWEEPFGRVVIEAMALGLPVIAANIGGPAEIIRDGIDGLLVAPRDPQLWADAVLRLADSAALRASLGHAAALRARDFAVPQHVAAMRQIYEETVASAMRH